MMINKNEIVLKPLIDKDIPLFESWLDKEDIKKWFSDKGDWLNEIGEHSADKVTATQITGVRVRFIPEVRANSAHQVTTRSLVGDSIFWEEWGGKTSSSEGGEVIDPTEEAPDPTL